MAYNEKSKMNTVAYQRDNLELIRFWVRRGEKSALEAEAKRCGYSVSRYIIEAINQKAARENRDYDFDSLLTMPRGRNEKKYIDDEDD